MSSKIWVVIPTYWGRPDIGIYDHPTPVDGESTLPALLDSLAKQEFDKGFKVLILISTTQDEFNQSAVLRTQEIADEYFDSLDIKIADHRTARRLNEFLEGYNLDLGISGMRGYAAVRNLQLLIPGAMNAEIIIAVDDDEIVAADYLKNAIRDIGIYKDGEKVVAIAGPYLDESGSPYLKEPTEKTNLLLDKAILMNQAIRQLLEDRSGISISPIAFGGNMVFHRSLFSQVGFDPCITRGEDIDYLINARIAGFNFHFNSDLTIIHHPPRQYEAPLYAKLRQDVIRFEYERQKVNNFGVDPESLIPYPGGLLTEDFQTIALHALRLESSPDLESIYGSPKEIVDFSIENAIINIQKYQNFQDNWARAIEIIFNLSIQLC